MVADRTDARKLAGREGSGIVPKDSLESREEKTFTFPRPGLDQSRST